MKTKFTYLKQSSGNRVQSVIHRKRSQDIHPIGGVKAKPLSKEEINRKLEFKNKNKMKNLRMFQNIFSILKDIKLKLLK